MESGIKDIVEFGIIGAGRVGSALARKFDSLGVAAWILDRSSHVTSAFENVRIFQSYFQNPPPARCLIFAVRDNEIISAVGTAVESLDLNGCRFACHLSGTHSIALLDTLNTFGVSTFSAHPMQTFGSDSLTTFDNVAWGLEINKSSEEFALSFVRKLGGVPLILPESVLANKAAYHAIGVAAANFLQATIAFAQHLCKQSGLDDKLLLPAIVRNSTETAINSLLSGNSIPLTGPIARGETSVVAQHIESLSEFGNSTEIYRAFSKALSYIAYSNQYISTEKYEELKRLL